MNKLFNIFILSITLGGLFSSCSEDSFSQIVEFDILKSPTKLVVNCNYDIGDDSLFVFVDKSRNVGETLSQNPAEFQNAKVELYKNGTKLFDIPYHKTASILANISVFQINNIASKMTDDATYLLKVSFDGLESVESEQITPKKPILANGIFKKEGFNYTSFGSVEKKNLLQFDFTDPAEENFYTIKVNDIIQDTVSKKTFQLPGFIILEQQFAKGLFDNDPRGQFTISDAIFNNKKIEFKIGVEDVFFFWDPKTQKQIKNAKLISHQVNILSLTKEKYLYEESLKEVGNSGGLFGEYVVVNSNIKHGYGIFSIKNKGVIDIPVK